MSRFGSERTAHVLLVVGGAAIIAEATTFDVAFMTDPIGPKALPIVAGALLLLAGLAQMRPGPRGPIGTAPGSGAVGTAPDDDDVGAAHEDRGVGAAHDPDATGSEADRSGPTPTDAGTRLLRVAGGAAAFVVYALTLEVVGFFVATTLVVSALGVGFSAPPRRAAAVGLVVSAALWGLFVGLLGLPLPVGELWMR